MRIRNTEQQFGLAAKLFHWVAALLILGLIWLGWWMVRLSYLDPWSHDSLLIHRSLGLGVLALAASKVFWLRLSPTPEPLPSLRPWERRSSKLVHWILFLSMFVIPISGYLVSTSAGASVPVFDWFDVPALLVVDETSRDLAIAVHYYVAYAVLALALLHAGAALKHQFVDRDGTLKRML